MANLYISCQKAIVAPEGDKWFGAHITIDPEDIKELILQINKECPGIIVDAIGHYAALKKIGKEKCVNYFGIDAFIGYVEIVDFIDYFGAKNVYRYIDIKYIIEQQGAGEILDIIGKEVAMRHFGL